jgi:protein subunit release factor B
MPANSRSFKIRPEEIHYDFIQSSGPGGQNVNKVATAVQLRFDARNSKSPKSGANPNLRPHQNKGG